MAESTNNNRAPSADERRPDRPLAVGMGVIAAAAAAVIAFAIASLFTGETTAGSSNLLGNPVSGEGLAPTDRPRLPAAPDAETSLSGRVLDTSGVSVPDVTITILPELAAPERGAAAADDSDVGGGLVIGGGVVTATTDASGRFSIAGLGRGLFRLRIEGSTVVTAEVRFLELPAIDLDITALRRVTLRGKVNGAATGEITVRARGELGEEQTIAAADGTFEIGALGEGVYRLWAEGDGFASPALRVEARGAATFEALELTLEPATTVRGRLIDRTTGAAVVGSVLLTAESGEPERQVVGDAAGNYVVASLLPGRWSAQAAATGYVPSEQLAFEADRERRLDLYLSRGATIEGVAVDPDGAPIEGALVLASAPTDGEISPNLGKRAELFAPATAPGTRFVPRGELGVMHGPIPFPPTQPLGRARIAQPISLAADSDESAADQGDQPGLFSDASGRFRIGGLRAGVYRVTASHPDFAGGVATGVEVSLGDLKSDVRVVLRRGIRISGAVTDKEGGAPIIGAIVTASIAGAPPIRAVTGERGDFVLPPIIGSARIEASASGYASAKAIAPVLADGGEKTIDFALERADKLLHGRLVDSAGFPVRGAQVSLVGGGGVGASTDSDGRFEISMVPTGSQKIAVTHPAFPALETTALAGDPITVTLPIGGGISGRARDERSGGAIAEASIEARRGTLTSVVRTNADGEFTIAPLAVGAWKLTIVAAGYARGVQTVEVPLASSPGEITVRELELELVRGAVIAGIVRDENGERVASASVKVGELETTTDIDGHFRLRDVPARGATTILVASGDRAGREVIELSPGDERSTLDVRIGPEAD